MKHLILAALFSVVTAFPASAQKLVDPAGVAPEFREAAEKRRAEQIKQRDCAKKADADLVRTRKELVDWKTASVRSGIVPWLGQHANCVGRGSDGHCSKYKLTDGTVLETDLPERVQ